MVPHEREEERNGETLSIQPGTGMSDDPLSRAMTALDHLRFNLDGMIKQADEVNEWLQQEAQERKTAWTYEQRSKKRES